MDAHERFCAAIAPHEEAYELVSFSYLAARSEGQIYLIQGRLDFTVTKAVQAAESVFESRGVLAGRCALKEEERDYAQFLKNLVSGKIAFRGLEIRLPPCSPTGALQKVQHVETDRAQRRLVFSVQAGPAPSLEVRHDLDWEVRAAPTPYDGLGDLAVAHGLNPQQLDTVIFEANAAHLAEIDQNSIVSGKDARPSCFLAHGISPERLKINYRVQFRGQIVERGSLEGRTLDWEMQERAALGTGRITIPEGALVQCFPVVDGQAQHRYWLLDNNTLPNAHRAAYEGYDNGLMTLKDFLADVPRKGRDSRDLEFGVTWLLWMFGFAPAYFGANPRTQDAPDLLATTPSGHFVVVECTTGLLKAENKLAKLHERTTDLRTRLNASGHAHLRVIPVIVTTMTREDIKADIEQAERLGTAVVTREVLDAAVGRTIVMQSADAMFADAEREIEEGRRRQAIGNDLPPPSTS